MTGRGKERRPDVPRIGVLGNGRGWHARALAAAAHRLGMHVEPLDFERLQGSVGWTDSPGPGESIHCGDVDLRTLDAVIVRSMPPAGLEPIVFRMDLLARLERAGTAVLNPARSLEFAIDKYRSLSVLHEAGVRVPRTVAVQDARAALEAFERLGGDVVLKPIFGGEGRGITRVTDRELAQRAFRLLERLGSVIYLQEFIPHEGFDIRILVIGDDAWGMRRCSSDWRTNVSRGARVEPFHAPPEIESLARTVSTAIGAPVVGVDILSAPDGTPYVIEANGVPGWRGMQRVVTVDLAEFIVRFARSLATADVG